MNPEEQEESNKMDVNSGTSLNRLRSLRNAFLYDPAASQEEQPQIVGPDHYQRPTYPQLPNSHDMDRSDWEYSMRRSMQEIIPNLFLGPYASAARSSLNTMTSAGLTHVICVRSEAERFHIRINHPNNFKYLTVELDDKSTQNIICHFGRVFAFINEAIESGGKVLVHGNTGTSRSASLVIAYLMNRFGISANQAIGFVQNKRFCTGPNQGFLKQLLEYEPIYRAQHTLATVVPSLDRLSIKRPPPDEDESLENVRKCGASTTSDMDMMDQG